MIQLTDIRSTAIQRQLRLRGFLCPNGNHADKIPFFRIQCTNRPGPLLILYIPSALHGTSAVFNPGGEMKGFLQPVQKLLPAGIGYILSDLLHIRLPVSRVHLHPRHCRTSFSSRPRLCLPGAVYRCITQLSFQDYTIYNMTSACHVFRHPADTPMTLSGSGRHLTPGA